MTLDVERHPSLGVPVGGPVSLCEFGSFDAVAVLSPAHDPVAESVQQSLQLAVVKSDLGFVWGTGLSLALQMMQGLLAQGHCQEPECRGHAA